MDITWVNINFVICSNWDINKMTWLQQDPCLCFQIGDLAVIDISATTIDQDESKVKNIPSAETKGLLICMKDDKLLSAFYLQYILTMFLILNFAMYVQGFILIQKMVTE